MIIKSQIVLDMYDELLSGKRITINEIINKYNISLRTFQRYIAEINAFFCNKFSNQKVVYDYLNKEYYLKNNNL